MPRPADTTPEVWERYVSMLMSRSNAERFLMGIRMFDAARAMALASAPKDLPPAKLRAWLYERTYGEPLPLWASEKDAAIELRKPARADTSASRRPAPASPATVAARVPPGSESV